MGAKLNVPPSANWLALQKVGELPLFLGRGQILRVLQEINSNPSHRRKKRKLGHESSPEHRFRCGEASSSSASIQVAPTSAPPVTGLRAGMKNGESIDSLRRMILGELEDQYTDHKKQYVSERRTPKSLDRLILMKARKVPRPRL